MVEARPVCEDVLLNESGVFGSSSEDSSNTLDSIKSGFFALSEGEEALCSNFEINGKLGSCAGMEGTMIGSESEEFRAALKLINDETGHSCRKKRCADRYDSSESSDR